MLCCHQAIYIPRFHVIYKHRDLFPWGLNQRRASSLHRPNLLCPKVPVKTNICNSLNDTATHPVGSLNCTALHMYVQKYIRLHRVRLPSTVQLSIKAPPHGKVCIEHAPSWGQSGHAAIPLNHAGPPFLERSSGFHTIHKSCLKLRI
jgi:hypothetical protein